MKKRYIAGLALALVGILSGCGQTQAADNTVSLTPVERKTDGPQMDMAVKYDFAGNHADVNGMEFRRYIWDGSAWENEGGTFTVNLDKVEENEGTIRFQPESDALNAEYIVIIDAQTPESGNSIQFAESPALSGLPTEWLTSAVAMQEEKIDDLAVDVEIPLVVRVFNTDGATHTVDINAFIEPDSSDELKNCIYADAITATFVYDDSIPK